VSITGEIGGKFLFLSIFGIVLVYATESSYQTTNVLDTFNKPYINLAINEALAVDEKTQAASLRPQDRGIKIGGNPYGIAVNSDNNMIYVIDKFYKKISFIDGDTDRIIKTVTIPNNRPADFKYNISDISSAIAIDQRFNLIYITNSGSNTVSGIDGSDGNTVTNITLDGSPRALAVESNNSRIHVVTNNNIQTKNETTFSSRVYTISGFFNRIEKEETATIDSEYLTAIDIDPVTYVAYVTGIGMNPKNTIYAINSGAFSKIVLSNGSSYNLGIAVDPVTNNIYTSHEFHPSSIFVSNANNSTGDVYRIDVTGAPVGIAVNAKKNLAYVADSASNLVHVIDTTTNKIIKNVAVGDQPRYIAVNTKTNMTYITNFGSGTISVINGTTNNITAGLRFSVNPPNAGSIVCNNQKNTKNFTRYDIGSSIRCGARSNNGFQFSSWSGDFDLSRPVGISSVFDFVYYSLVGNRYANNSSMMYNGYNHNTNDIPSTTFVVSKYGTLAANFINASSIPPEFWAPIYGLIPGFFIPSAISWLNGKRQRKYFRESLGDIGKSDKESLERHITALYSEGKINDSHYQVLKDKISDFYKENDENDSKRA